MRTFILTMIGFLTIWAVPARTDCATRKRVVVQTPVVVAPAVIANAVTPIVATTFFPITVPTYGVSYVGGGDNGDTAKLRDEIRQLRDMLSQLSGPPNANANANAGAGAKAEPSVSERAVVLVQNKCASCHTGANAKKGFAIFDGTGKLNVSPKLLGAIYRGATPDGKKMPPEPAKPFTDDEVAVVQDGLGR